MDSRLRGLWREYHASGDTTVAARLYRAMLSVGSSVEDVVALRDSLDPRDASSRPLIQLISKHLYREKIPYPTPADFPRVSFHYRSGRPPEGASNWALLEFDETRYWWEGIQDKVIAITGVYLVDTEARVYIASTVASVALSAMYPNIIHVIDAHELPESEGEKQEALNEQIEDEWRGSTQDVDYMAYNSLSNAVEWYWIPQGLITEILLDNPDFPEAVDGEVAIEDGYIRDELREYFLANQAL